MTALGTSIRIFLADGTPDGLRIVEKSNWTGLALVVPRSLYSQVRTRDELQRPAVYVLRGVADDDPSQSRIYIGEADSAASRIDRHLKVLDWWDELVVFTSKDANLNKAYIKHIEARLVEVASRAKRSRLDNAQTPQAPKLSDADVADAEGFLENMLLIYPVLGVDAFEEPQRQPTDAADHPPLALAGKDAEATGRDLPEGFVVYAGAQVRRDSTTSMHGYLDSLREQLVREGVLANDSDHLRLTQDYTFRSPSTAAGVVLGRSANGRVEWKAEDGRTLKEIQEAGVPDSDEEQEA